MKWTTLKIVWLRINLQLQDTAKSKRDSEPTPKSLIYQLHYLAMQCEEHEVFLQYKQIREEQRAKLFAFHFVPSTIWLSGNRHTKGVRRRMEMFLYRNLNADNTQNCSDIKITHSTFSCLSSVLLLKMQSNKAFHISIILSRHINTCPGCNKNTLWKKTGGQLGKSNILTFLGYININIYIIHTEKKHKADLESDIAKCTRTPRIYPIKTDHSYINTYFSTRT